MKFKTVVLCLKLLTCLIVQRSLYRMENQNNLYTINGTKILRKISHGYSRNLKELEILSKWQRVCLNTKFLNFVYSIKDCIVLIFPSFFFFFFFVIC